MIHIGFTGTRHGISQKAALRLARLLKTCHDRYNGDITLHHGDCIGADAAAHDMAQKLGWQLEIHPPTQMRYRACCEGAELVHAPLGYLTRNSRIVAASAFLIACPILWITPNSVSRSGTWYTIREAQRFCKKVYVIVPTGVIKEPEPLGRMA